MKSAKFRNALVSVSNKAGLVDFLKPLVVEGLRVVSTGGTAKHLRDQGIPVVDVSEQTGFPEVMDGRVKTLHPRVHMALLARAGHDADSELLKREGLEPFDLVVVNLYPFEAHLKPGPLDEEQVEYIDIGGPSLLRAAAKSFSRLSVVCDPHDYSAVIERGPGDEDWRRHLAAKVFQHVSAYDAMIANALGGGFSGPDWAVGGGFVKRLRYGENPQQPATWYRRRGIGPGLHQAEVLQGKELSYNNLLDLDAAATAVNDFRVPCAVAVKHTNPCGVAVHDSPDAALALALAADPVSVFGGILAVNFAVTENMVEQMAKIFLECVVAPAFTPGALAALKEKKNLRVLAWPGITGPRDPWRVRSIWGGFLVQGDDPVEDWQEQWTVLGERPTGALQRDLVLAWKVAARLKSNAIAVAGGGRSLGLGMGQVNRVDAVAQALTRWKHHHPGEHHAVLASDAFFPFADSIQKIAEAGIRWVIQPGGSLRDEEVKAAAKTHGINMILTGTRHFSH